MTISLGLPPDFDWASGEFGPYMLTVPWETTLKPRIIAAISYLKSKGAVKFGAIGVCWGQWVVAHALADAETSEITFGASPHPSITAICGIYGENYVELVSNSRGPTLFLPAGNDPDSYRVGGDLYEALKAKFPDTITHDEFRTVNHGFFPRGDTNDINVKDHIVKAYNYITDFFAQQFAK